MLLQESFVVGMTLVVSATAQRRILVGRVAHENRNPVKGVSVFSNKDKTGTQTNKEGNYCIKLESTIKRWFTKNSCGVFDIREPEYM